MVPEHVDSAQQLSGAGTEQVAPQRAKDKTIGQVLSHLDAEFPGLSASKIRFLEDRGLLFPQRTNTGYRKYSAEDIQRLRYILTLQRDHYMPLKVIKEKVQEIDAAGETFDPQAAGEPAGPPSPEQLLEQAERESLTMRELARRTNTSLALLRELITFGLIEEHEDGTFDEHAVQVTTLCDQLTAHGLQPRHLRPLRPAADREVGLVQQVVTPLASRRDEESRERAVAAAREISGLCTRLHATMVAERVSQTWA